MAPGLKYLFIDCICPHHDIITSSTHAPATTAAKRRALPSAPLQSTVPKVTPTDLARLDCGVLCHTWQPPVGRSLLCVCSWPNAFTALYVT